MHINDLSVIVTLLLLETLLSIDNAVVLALLVAPLRKDDQAKALRYGIIGAYVFRGLCLLFATWLIHIWWLKVIGGAYLVWLAVDYFRPSSPKDGDVIASDRGLIGILTPMIGSLWATIVAVELLDVTFSIDNIFAAVALTDKLWLIMVGVGIGILAMRFVAQSFVGLLKKYPRLESAAFLVIGLLGIKLLVTTGCGFMENNLCTTLESETVDIIFSVLSVALFALPILEQWVMEKKEKILTRPTLPQKHYLYHKVPPHMHGKVLFPLNDLRAIDEDLYLLQEKKYEGRKNIMKREIPPLDCLWNDVLHFSPIHPALLKKELESRGLAIKEFQYFQIDPDMLDPERTIVYLCQREVVDNSINPKDFVVYNPSLIKEYSQVPDQLKKYYQDKIDQGETPLLYAGAPHILYRGTLDISQVPIVKI